MGKDVQKKKKVKKQKDKRDGSRLMSFGRGVSWLFRRYPISYVIATLLFVAGTFIPIITCQYNRTFSDTLADMGDGAAQFNDELYNNMEMVMAMYVDEWDGTDNDPFAGPDVIAIREATISKIMAQTTGSDDKPASSEVEADSEGGSETDNTEAKIVDRLSMETVGDTIVITTQKFNGYFTASEEFIYSERFELLDTRRNFQSLSEYLSSYWDDFNSRVYHGTFIRALEFEGIALAAASFIWFTCFLVKKHRKSKVSKTEKANVPAEAIAQSTDVTAPASYEY